MPGVANAKPQAVKIILIAELGDDIAQSVMPAVPATQFEFGDAGGMSSSSWATRMASGGMRKKFASVATAWPLRFIKVVGINRRTSRP